MPHKCSFPGCKTNYEVITDGKNQSIPFKAVFSFPSKNDPRYNLWKRYVNHPEFESLKNPRLCEDHFDPNDIIRHKTKTLPTKTAVPCMDFNIHQSLFVPTPEKGEHFMDYYPKKTRLDFSESVGNIDPFLDADASHYLESYNKKPKKYKDSFDLIVGIKNFLKNRSWSILENNSKFQFAFFTPDCPNMQSVISVHIDTSVDINKIGSMSNISVSSQMEEATIISVRFAGQSCVNPPAGTRG